MFWARVFAPSSRIITFSFCHPNLFSDVKFSLCTGVIGRKVPVGERDQEDS